VGSNEQRKADHIRINLSENVAFPRTSTGLECYRLVHCALPELDLQDVDTSVTLLGKQLDAPLLISSMTGGTPEALSINRRLAEAAQAAHVAMGLGSLRAAIEDPSLAYTFQVRDVAPDILLLANLGAVQLNYGYGADECRRAVEIAEADGLILHLNPLQEALQPEGNTRFGGLLTRIEMVCRTLEMPVIVKEVGWGIPGAVARRLVDAGVAAIEVAGAGGTSWSQVEMHRTSNAQARRVAEAFADWGIPTAESVRQVRQAAPELPIVASGGIRDGIAVATALALGAHACGLAAPFLRAESGSQEGPSELIETLVAQLRIAMFAAGAADVAALHQAQLVSMARSGADDNSA